MLALRVYSNSAGPVLDTVDPPELAPGQVRLRVAAAAVNPVDALLASGRLRQFVELPDPVGLGWDVSGTITEVGNDVVGLSLDDRVAGILLLLELKPSIGTHAEETVVPADAVARVPDNLDLIEAASLPLNALAAKQALELLGPPEGRTLLVTGGAGALGGYALSLAVRNGWNVTALARETDGDFVAKTGAGLITTLPGPTFDAVLDAAVLLGEALGAVRDGGSLVGVAPASPVTAEREVSVHTLSVRPDSEAIAELLELAAEGALDLRVATRVPLHEARRAYAAVVSSGRRGCVLVLP